MKKINNYIIYKAICEIFDETPYEQKEKTFCEIHMKNMIYSYAKKHNINLEPVYDNMVIKQPDDLALESENWDLIKKILKTEEPDKMEMLNEDEEKDLLESVAPLCNPINNDLEPVSKEEYKRICGKLENNIKQTNNIIYGYKEPLFLKIFKFVPTVKNIINYNKQKHIVDTWKNMDKEKKQKFISNINIKLAVEQLAKH